jgi:OPA family glycerol-3-phosphate transporter-like MFS transporter
MIAPGFEPRFEPEGQTSAHRRWKWRVLLAFCAFYALSYLGRFNFSLIQTAVIADLGITRADTGWINSWMFWGFALGGLLHGRIAERIGYRVVLLYGAAGIGLFNFIASHATSVNGLLVPWALAGFFGAATWAPGLGLIAQWWSRRERGRAVGLASAAAGLAMILVWLIAPWTAAEYGWRAAMRWPPLLVSLMGVMIFFVARDRPAQVGLPDYIESEQVSRDAEEASAGAEKGLAAYLHVMSNWRFLAACHVRGLDVLVRYGVVSWAPVYYAQAGGFSLKEMSVITLAYPIGIMLGPLTGGYISDRLFGSNRSRVIMLAGLLSSAAISGIALSPPDNIPLAVGLLFLTGFTINLAPLPALALDLVGRRLAGTGAGLLSVHGYIYGALQAWLFGWLSMAVPGGWTWVFAAMAAARLISIGVIWRVRA